jgi:tetratricopeptide (TPR) repeat protein
MVRIMGRNDKDADILNLVYEWLRNKHNGNWVMILDNADDKDVFTSCPSTHRQASSGKQIRDFLPQSSNGSLLVTSRSRDAAYHVTCNYKHILTVEPMTENEAMALLQSQLEEVHSEPEMKLLADTLGFVPLAISQAAANISRRSLPISKYLDELRKGNESSASLLDESSPQLRRDSGRSNSIVATWKVTFEYVRKAAPSAARLLSLMCFFDRQDIPEALLEGQYGEEVNIASQKRHKVWWRRRIRMKRKKAEFLPVKSLPCDFEQDWLTLRDFSLIKLHRNRRNFSMHPMVQFTTLKWLVLHREHDAWSQHFISLMNYHFPDPNLAASKVCEPLIAHAFAAVPYRPVDAAIQPLQTWAELTLKVANYYNYYRNALDFAQKLYRIVAEAFVITLGKASPESLNLNIKRGYLLILLDRKIEAEELHRRTMHLQTETLGPTHPNTLATMDRIGDILEAQGRDSEAEETFVQALNIRLHTLGPKHEITQDALDKYGMYLRRNSRYKEAYNIWRVALQARVQGDPSIYDPTWATQLGFLGLGLLLSGNSKEAEVCLREALSEREKGLMDEEYASSLTQLARALATKGDYIGAEPFLTHAYEWHDKHTSSRYENKLQVMSELTRVLGEVDGRLDDAENVARRCLTERRERSDAKSYDLYESMFMLGDILEKQGRCEEALELVEQAYEGARKDLGEQHDDTQEYRRSYDRLMIQNDGKQAKIVPNGHDRTIIDAKEGKQNDLEDTCAGAEENGKDRIQKADNGQNAAMAANSFLIFSSRQNDGVLNWMKEKTTEVVENPAERFRTDQMASTMI